MSQLHLYTLIHFLQEKLCILWQAHSHIWWPTAWCGFWSHRRVRAEISCCPFYFTLDFLANHWSNSAQILWLIAFKHPCLFSSLLSALFKECGCFLLFFFQSKVASEILNFSCRRQLFSEETGHSCFRDHFTHKVEVDSFWVPAQLIITTSPPPSSGNCLLICRGSPH